MMRKAWNQTPESIRKDYGETYFRKETEYLSAHLNEGRTQVSRHHFIRLLPKAKQRSA